VSIGDENDKGMFIWDMHRGCEMVSANRMSKKVNAIGVREEDDLDGEFVTVGKAHLKFWKLY